MLEEKKKQSQIQGNRRSNGSNGGDCFWKAAGETRGEVCAGGSAPNEECSDDDYDALLGREVSIQMPRRLRCSTGCRSADSAYRAYAGTLATARME